MTKPYSLIIVMLVLLVFPMAALGAQIFQFPLTGTDTITVAAYPWWWNIGDYAEGQRSVAGEIGSGTLNLVIPNNSLGTSCSPDNWVDLNVSINGLVVATHRVNVGDTSASIPFTLASPVSGTITVRLEETNTVCSGGGSIQINDVGSSTLELNSGARSVPTMTEWGMIIFMALAGLGSVYYLRRVRIAEK